MENNEEKVWGLYTTMKNPKSLDLLDEIDIFTKINNLGGYKVWASSEEGEKYVPKMENAKELENQYNLEYLIYYTRRFGVEFDFVPSSTSHVEISDTYLAWYEFWYKFFATLTEDAYNQLLDEKLMGNDISKYLPLDNWMDVYEKKINRRLR